MKVWAYVSQKGGAGKSTLATQLGVLAQQKKEHVAIVDLDAQASALSWYSRREKANNKKITRGGPYVMRALPSDLGKIIAAAPTMGATLLMIDTAPATDEVFMREYIKEWKRLMKATPKLEVQREP